MGMQKSEELKEVIQVVYEQFVHLNIHIEHTGFIMDYKTRDDMHIWLADRNEVPSEVTIPYFDCAHWNSFNESKKKGKNFFANHLSFEEKNKFYQDLFKLIPGMPEETKEYYFGCPGLAISTVLLDNVGLYIENFSGIPYSDEENATLMRFGKVFQQTYTRFNDLKLAEAHAVQAEEDLVKLQTEKKRAEDALSELQVTQKQLIQSEKMASLGELTAGIAHEIQNPLNFVNNFSDVNKELLVEMKEEIEKGNTEEVIAIANDIISNEEKINHHGKRADAIVKGMLQHSRSSSGVKEPTDINELADEYLRLAYHGLRAKDKSFNAIMKTDFDEAIGRVTVIPQDIGRVFLNLITNAFYVVAEKKKQLANGYEPTVTVTTKKESDKVFVSVKDNGNGIPQKVLDKIFQPFFTTKPTGQGTGLGLSLSYDIVKAHSGEIKVKTKDGEGSEFVIQLPIGQ
jgi:signal transduction histidine kinase